MTNVYEIKGIVCEELMLNGDLYQRQREAKGLGHGPVAWFIATDIGNNGKWNAWVNVGENTLNIEAEYQARFGIGERL